MKKKQKKSKTLKKKKFLQNQKIKTEANQKKEFQILPNKKGVALLMALSFLAAMSFLVLEISRETLLEYSIASKKLHRVQSYYAARAGMELSLMRISIYSEIASNFKDYIKNKQALSRINNIWSFDISWPISDLGDFLDKQLSQSLMNRIKDLEKKSFLKVKYYTKIHPQSSQIDINNLGSPSKTLSSFTRELILGIFEKEKEQNKKFKEKYNEVNFEELVNNMADWVDYDSKSLNGGKESSHYDIGEDHNNQFVPPNQSFKSFSELHMVAGMKDDFYELLLPYITLSGEKGLNMNQLENLKFLSYSNMLDEEEIKILSEQIKESEEFLTEEDWNDFITRIDKLETFKNKPFIFDSLIEENFFVSSTGEHKNVKSEIRVYTQNVQKSTAQLKKVLEREERQRIEEEKGFPPSHISPTTPSSSTKSVSSSQTIVYWSEI